MCNCKDQPEIVDISDIHSEFISTFKKLDIGNWVFLASCCDCNQLWVVEEWDKYQTSYAVKTSSKISWKEYNYDNLILDKIIENRGGLSDIQCKSAGCDQKQVKESVFCANHMYKSGIRA